MTQNGQKFKNIDHEYVSQVQDAQVRVEENPPKNKQPPPQTTMAKTIYDDDDADVYILAAINSINNTQPNEVGYYAEKIERIQDAIVVLFEKIQNSLTTNHNSSDCESTNAVKQESCDARFAPTPPPSSVTSVRNTERIDIEEVLHNEHDLGDLCDRQVGQIVERSDVRDTLAEAVDYGVTNEQINSTGSFLAKSEQPTSPYSPFPNPSNDSILYTSLEDYTNASELLPKYNVLAVNKEINVDIKNNLEFDTIDTVDELIRETQNTVTNTRVKNDLSSVKVNEMTVTRLADNEQENPNKDLQSNEALEHTNNILSNDLQIDEMKFEMNRVKGALPSSVSERALGKHDNLITGSGRHAGTNATRLSSETPLSNNRLSNSLSSSRNYNDSSYTPRSALQHESSALLSKRSTHLPQDTITNRSVLNTPPISETISNRSALNSIRNSNDTTADGLSSRRPSLGALRNTQSTSLLSVDLPRYTPLPTVSQTDQTPLVSRAVSIDSSDVLPERTRLRRQRRLRTQDSQDEPEDPIERLNRLKARISASLSEVKGVLKQYSTETENDTENQTATLNSIKEAKEEEKKDEGPVSFRFVKKVRRRSLFTEEEEKEQKEKEKNEAMLKDKNENQVEKQLGSKDETDNIKSEIGLTLPTQNSEINKQQIQQVKDNIESNQQTQAASSETNEVKLNKNLYTLKEDVQESLEDQKQPETKPQPNENNKTPRDELQTLKQETKGAIPKSANDATQETTTAKTKKKVIIKSKDPARRASLAAVEGSKIEPPVKLAIPANIHRRPSDSEAVVKKKLLTAKINTSGVVEEVTPKPKIVKVKRSSIKNKNNSQLATEQSKLKKEEKEEANDKSDDHVKPLDEDNKSIHTDKNKDVLMPKQNEQQQQNNTEITSQRNLLLPTQLVIDEAASLNVKTIENSVPPPKQQQQQQQLEQKQEKQATIKSTTTNFKSNDLQAGGGMLESVTTVLSSSTTSEANGQIKRENVVVPQDDFGDLLQQETTIIKPSITTNKQHELSLVQPVGNQQSKVKDLLLNQASTEKFKENLENQQTADQQQKPTTAPEQQQVVATTDVVVAKSVDDNKHDVAKAEASLKEPCIDKTPTSEQQQHRHHHQLLVEGEQSITNAADTKTISSPHISISSTTDITQKTTASSADTAPQEEKAEAPAQQQQQNTMPELQLAPAPVQTAEIIAHPEHHKKKVILKKIVRQTSVDKTKKTGLETTKPQENVEQKAENVTVETASEPAKDELTEECSESTELSESASIDSEEVAATEKPKKERKVKQRVIIKRQKRRLSIGDTFFHPGAEQEPQNTDIETLEKPISYVTDDDEEDNATDEPDEDEKKSQEQEEPKKPLKSCIMHKEYNIGDEVLYAERFKKTQIKWRRGRIKERITSISYLLDIDGKDVSSHINYLKRYTGRKVCFGGKEYLEIDYEQLAEEEEKAERLQRRTYSIWNMV
ncbi:inner centromere protein A [Calliphora vicina]|uniref:inner centromere protein A n=1 Tax=Calliphora vicina TaxID=7373 RepID=UPI00325B2CD7